MKNFKLVLIACGALMFVTKGFGQISGSAHDFSGQTLWNPKGEICIVCHTPHNADATVTDAPLWNHATTTFNYTGFIYTSSTFDATGAVPDGSSKLCLSCHDGTVAVDNFGGGVSQPTFIGSFDAGGTRTAGYANLGSDLRNDHPISFLYADSEGADAEIKASTSGTLIGGTIATDYLIGGKVQCASCHDVHNNGTGPTSLLKISNSGSQLCLECHIK